MSAAWAPLLPAAMVGTDRHTGAWPAWPGEIGHLLNQVAASDDTAAGALRIAAVLACCSLAGARGESWSTPLPAPAADESLPALAEASLLRLVGWSFVDGPGRAHHAICETLARTGHRLPAALLPQALELGRRSLALRPLLLPVLGERGLWLAAQREDWRYAAGTSATADSDARWAEGTMEQRRSHLSSERRRDPAAARERLAAALPELPARERAELAQELATGLGADDEPLLDTLRNDRSREVRQVALNLLLRLPAASHPHRAATRIAALLKHERALLRKRWQIDAPAETAGDWKADQVDAARPQHESLGERGWWLYQLVRQVPLAWWPQHTGLTPAELRQWADTTDWTEALLRGWRDVLFAAPDVAWCEALLDDWPRKLLRDDPSSVLALLPIERRERYWRRHLAESPDELNALVSRVLAACPAGETLSTALSGELARSVRQRAESGLLRQDWGLMQQLPELGCVLHHDSLAPLAELPRPPEETPSHANNVYALTQVVALRCALHTFATQATP
jgi:hypothetical protein